MLSGKAPTRERAAMTFTMPLLELRIAMDLRRHKRRSPLCCVSVLADWL